MLVLCSPPGILFGLDLQMKRNMKKLKCVLRTITEMTKLRKI